MCSDRVARQLMTAGGARSARRDQSMGKDRLLMVDDEQANLDLYMLLLGADFDIHTAPSAEVAIDMLRDRGGYPLVVTDMHMPGLSGNDFLRQVQEFSPDTVRIMVTGDLSQATAVEAANQGQVFRFLNKPCSRQLLRQAIRDGLEEHRRHVDEKELLASTVNGCVNLLGEVLSLVSPVAFAKTSRVTRIVEQICERLHVTDAWEVAMAATLSQLGCIALPDELLGRVAAPAKLSPAESDLWKSHPKLGHDLIAKIPRMDRVAGIVLRQQLPYVHTGTDARQERRGVPWRAACLRAALEFDACVKLLQEPDHALFRMKQSDPPHPRDVLEALAELVVVDDAGTSRLLKFHELRTGMILAENLVDRDGRVLLTSGQRIAELHMERIYRLGYGSSVREPIRVLCPDARA
jgi:response regulator RpfG family c-di-GMP phosphodiesterase